MPRAPSGLSLLLMAGLAFATSTSSTTSTTITTTSPLEIINPWLSASDLQSVFAAADLRPACSPHKPSCPPPCPAANSTNSTQCLYYLKESHKEEVCDRDWGPERRRNVLHGLRMRHCCEHAVDSALPQAAFSGGNTCRKYLDALLELDHLADRVSCGHADLLTRYDCGQNYSIAHHCNNCKEAYRRWVCSSLVPHYTRAGERIKPCLSVCQQVEQQCPYLLPESWTNTTVPPGETAYPTPQYAGEPTFLCIDPNIPESGEQRAKSLRGSENCCYRHCSSAAGRGGSGGLEATTSAFNSAGGGTTSQILGICEHCPGRPPNISLHQQQPNNNTNNNSSSSSSSKKKSGTSSTATAAAAAEAPVYRAAGAHPATSSSSASPTAAAAAATTSSSLSSTSTSSSSDGVVTRTFNQVFLIWTAWITILEHTQTIYNTLKYLLVLCVSSVWTTWLTLLKPKQQQQQQQQQEKQQEQQPQVLEQQQLATLLPLLQRWQQKKTIFSTPVTCS